MHTKYTLILRMFALVVITFVVFSSEESIAKADKFETSVKDPRMLLLQANLHVAKGQTDRAIEGYSEIISDYRDKHELVRLARKNLVETLLDMESVNVNLVEQHLSAFESTSAGLDVQLWNYKCRLLFRRVLMSLPEQRENVWRSGIQDFFDDHIVLSEKALEDLDSFVESLGDDRHLSSMRVLTDMMLLVPDIKSMRQLNWRRMSIFSRKANWPEAILSARLDIMLSLASSEGPTEAIKRCLKIMAAAGVPSLEQEELVNNLFGGLRRETGTAHNGVNLSKKRNGCVDRLLRSGAKKALEKGMESLSARRRSFLYLFAGQHEKALKCVHESLVATTTDPTDILDAFGDLSIAMSIGNGRVRTSQKFLKWLSGQGGQEDNSMNISDDDQLRVLAECERAFREEQKPVADIPDDATVMTYGNMNEEAWNDLISLIRSRLDEKVIDWGRIAYDHAEIKLAVEFWAHAINDRNDSGKAKLIIDKIYQIAKGAKGIEDALKGMKQVLTKVTVPFSQKYVMKKIAALHYEQGDYEQCLATLDNADALKSEKQDKQDIATAFIRVLSMIRLRQFDKALAMLQDMGTWPGTPEQHARASFLEGWIFLQQNQKPKALLSLKRVIDKYGDTSFASKAKELVQRLEGI